MFGDTLDVPADGGGDFGGVFVIRSGGLGAGLVIGCGMIVGSLAFVSFAKNCAMVSRQAPGFIGVPSL